MADKGGREVVVITGAGAGVGRAVAQAFAQHGAAVGLLARNRERLEAAREEVESLGGTGLAIDLDVADAAAVEAAAASVEQSLGPIDIWVNNAMLSVFSPVKEMSAEEFKRVTEVTYLGYVYGTLAALKRMLPRDRGVIVQVGSALAYRSIPLQSAYCAAKHAVVGFTDSLRSELIHDGSRVRVTAVHLPALNTPHFSWVKNRLPRRPQPVPPIFQPEIAAQAVYWAAHHQRRELLVGWPTVSAIWGQKVLAGWLDRYLAQRAYEGQQYDGADDPSRPSNLWRDVPGPFGAHGDFDERATAHSWQTWANLHSGRLSLLGATLAGAAALWRRQSR
ncbi:MAG: SDR family oxidoreductase [Chloroflexota bacterium]